MSDRPVTGPGVATASFPAVDPAEQWKRLWEQGQRPDLDEFLTGAGSLSPAQVAAVLRVDQRQRWQAGQPVPAEAYLERYPALAANPEHAVDLIWSEFLLREHLGERPDLADYLRRFPAHAATLRAQAELHQALHANVTTVAPALAPHQVSGPNATASRPAQPAGPVLIPQQKHSEQEVQTLLRKRLRFILLFACMGVLANSAPVLRSLLELGLFPFYVLIVAAVSVPTVLVWSRLPLSLQLLRWMESVFFAGGVVMLTWLSVSFISGGGLAGAARDNLSGVIMAARAVGLSWFGILVIYGILIPNTWRRCAAIVGTAAVWGLGVNIVFGLRQTSVAFDLVVAFLTQTASILAGAAALAIYGSHRIEVLRQKAAEARRLGPYQLQRRLGSGGMGEVYLAEHVLLKRPCAVKLIRPDRAGAPGELQRFEREVRATSALTHPNTVQVFDYGHAEDGTFYYAMEYLPGLSLEELVEKHGPLPPARAIHLLRQLCGALTEAHAVGLIHRDVKPGNVIVGQRGGKHDVVKLLDFGLVRSQRGGPDETRLTQEGAIAGTPAFMSPEQAGGQDHLDGRSDIYSLGALAYFLLAGQAPFAGRSMIQMLLAHLQETPKPLTELRPDVPVDLQAVILRCLAKNPADRFPDVRSLDRALADCAAADQWAEAEAAAWWNSSVQPRPGAGPGR